MRPQFREDWCKSPCANRVRFSGRYVVSRIRSPSRIFETIIMCAREKKLALLSVTFHVLRTRWMIQHQVNSKARVLYFDAASSLRTTDIHFGRYSRVAFFLKIHRFVLMQIKRNCDTNCRSRFECFQLLPRVESRVKIRGSIKYRCNERHKRHLVISFSYISCALFSRVKLRVSNIYLSAGRLCYSVITCVNVNNCIPLKVTISNHIDRSTCKKYYKLFSWELY